MLSKSVVKELQIELNDNIYYFAFDFQLDF